MAGKYTTDILIEGNGLSAAALAYYIAQTNPNEDITLLQNEEKQDIFSFLTPSILLPLTELSSSLMAKAFSSTGSLLEELHSITSQFELSKHPLALIFRTKKAAELMDEILAKLAESQIKHTNYATEDIAETYTFLNREEEIYLTEIYDAFTCSDIHSLISTYRNIAEENNVHIINSSSEMNYNTDENCIETNDYVYDARKLTLSTSPNLLSGTFCQNLKAYKVSTPIIEKFPRISLYDIDTKSSMWLEEAGYFHIFQLVSELNQSDACSRTKAMFNSIFPYFGELEIVDEVYSDIKVPKKAQTNVKKVPNTNLIQLQIPIQNEFSLAPILASSLSKLIAKQEKEIFENISLEFLINH